MVSERNKLGDYVILGKIAHGGMAEIYKAKTADPHGIERLVVIKRILPHISSHPEYIEMLIDEAKIAVHFTHGNIAQIYDLAKVGDDYFIVMEYVDGKTLGQIIREFRKQKTPLPIDIVVYCMIEICRGLEYMHKKKGLQGEDLDVVHRDISPQNIILSYSGTVKIIDFGVAKAQVKLSQTESGVLKGKFAYMSPEQAGGHSIDRRSDIFSTGVILWELLTKQRLFKRKTNPETVRAVKRYRHPLPSTIRSEIPRTLDRIIDKALQKRPGLRYQSASDMAYDLTHFLMSYNPNFKPLHITQFLYENFGPELDEAHLPPEIPHIKMLQNPLPLGAETHSKVPMEDRTRMDSVAELVGKLKPKHLFWVTAIIVLVFFAGFFASKFPAYFEKGNLSIKVEPSDATVVLDGGVLKNDDEDGLYSLKPLANRIHNLSVAKEGYFAQAQQFKLLKNEQKNYTFKLEKQSPPFGDLKIVTSPAGATIYMNDRELAAKTPTTIEGLKHNEIYQIGLYLDGYRYNQSEVKITGGKENLLDINLGVDYSIVEIDSIPPGAQVLINGNEKGLTPLTYPKIIPEREMNLQVFLAGYEPISQNLTLKAGEKRKLIFTLKSRPTQAP